MLDHVVEALAVSLGVTEKGISVIENVIDSEPARRVRACGVAGNKSVRYPSKKMGFVVQAESQLEFCSVLMKEYAKDVFKYYDQPPSLDLVYQSGARKVRSPSILDYFVLSKSFIGYEEWKPSAELMKIAEKRPDHICFDASLQRYVSPAIERALKGTGLTYRICTEKDLNILIVQNYNFLDGYFKSEPTENLKNEIREIIKYLNKNSALSISDAIELGYDADSIYYAIAAREIYFPVADLDIKNQETSYIFFNENEWNKYKKITALGESKNIVNLDNNLHQKLQKQNPEELSKAVEKLKNIKNLIAGEFSVAVCAANLRVTERTVRRMRAAVVNAKTTQEQLLAVMPNTHKKGNSNAKISSVILDQIDVFFNEAYLNKKAISPHKLSLKVIAWCRENNLHPPSKTTVYEYVNSNPDWVKVLFRQGVRAAYQKTAYLGVESEQADFRAGYFLARCHVDHTPLDVELVDDFGESMGKAWLTIIIDEFTGFILAFYLSYRSPSYISLMMALRGMVRNHQCLPESVMVDGGKEFQGYDFEVLCGLKEIKIFSREGQPRDGGAVERKFGSANTQLIHNLDGNTKFMKNVREISRSHNPKKSAIWTMYKLSKLINTYIEENNNHSAKIGALSPALLIEKSKNLYGERDYLKQTYDEEFIFHTMPYIPRKTASLRRGKPIKYDYHEYWHNSFVDAPPKSIKVPVKWDPENSEIALVFFESWVECRLTSVRNKSRATERELAAEATRQEAKINRKARQEGYVVISSALDKAEEILLAEEGVESREAPSISGQENEEEKNPSEFSLFDLVIPRSIEK